jgi:RNA polymerase sigma factor, sigma-70 family
MTNEELVLRIKAGETALMTDLWAQVERFVYRQAHKFFNSYRDRCTQLGLQVEDLAQEGYFGIHKAVELFDSERAGTFLTYAGYQLKTSFFTSAKMRHSGWQNNTSYKASSLNAPVSDENTSALLDTLIDKSDLETEVVERVYAEQLGRDLDDALNALSEKQAIIMREVHLLKNRPIDVSQRLGVSRATVCGLGRRAFIKLRENKTLQACYANLGETYVSNRVGA